MKWRNLAIVTAVFLALGAYVYFYEVKGQKKREEVEEKEKKLFQFEQKDIASIEIKTKSDEITLQKDKDAWKLVKPIQAKADKSAADSVVSDFAAAKIERTLDEPNINWKTYGLDAPLVKISARLSDGKVHQLELGEKDFTDFSVFARIPGQNKVLVVPSSLLTSANKTLFDFRDKTVIEFARDQIKELAIRVKGKDYDFEKTGEDWLVKKPFQSLGDKSEINSILSDLEFAKADEFIQASSPDLKSYGLNSPEAQVDLLLGDNRARKTLLLGKKVDSHYYAKDESRDQIFKVKEDLYKKLDLDPQKVRDKKVARFERGNISQIEVKLPEKTFSFFKGSDDKWKMSKPEGYKGKYVVEYKLFWPIEDLEAKEFIDKVNPKDPKYGFDKPSAEIKLVDKNKKLTEIVLGKIDKDRVYVKTSGGPTLYKVDKKVVDDLNFKTDELIEK